MQFSRLAAPLSFLLAIQILTGCGSPAGNANTGNASASANSSSTSKVVPKDNVEEFAILVHLPYEPEEVAWTEDAAKKTLTAVVRFSPENTAKLSAEAVKLGTPTPETLSVESWYPAELIAQGELSGESTVHGTSYPAESFLNPPYTKGKLARIEYTDYFILHISG